MMCRLMDFFYLTIKERFQVKSIISSNTRTSIEQLVEVGIVGKDNVASHIKEEAFGGHVGTGQTTSFRLLHKVRTIKPYFQICV